MIYKNILIIPFAFLLALSGVSAQERLEDIRIEDAIEDEYRFDHAIDVNKIDVNVVDGIAELKGSVSNLKAKERATKIARLVKGVRSVANRIDVYSPANLSDNSIEANIIQALLKDPATDSFEIGVDVHNNIVSLTGTVESYQEKELCANVAKSVRGVENLVNNIEIDFVTNRSDSQIKSEVEEALKWNATIDDGLIDVNVDDGEVELSGVVGSAAEKSNAFFTSWVTGVKLVDNSDLRVEWWAKDAETRKNKNVPRTDEQIREAITDAMAYDPRVYSFRITPEVNDGQVTLRGVVNNLKAKNSAGKLAENTTGVTGVNNRIKVRWADILPSDSEIKADIEYGLAQNSITQLWEIDVDVINGIATLTGLVDSYLEKKEAGWIASGVTGVTEVNNLIRVNYPFSYYWWGHYPYYDLYIDGPDEEDADLVNYPNDINIKSDIEHELIWSNFVDAEQVEVIVSNGHVTLKGTVDSRREYREAERNAREVGVKSVNNELEIKN